MIPLTALLGLCVFAASGIQYSRLRVTGYTVTSPRLPSAFDGFTILHLSDLHGASFGDDNADLFRLIEEAQPDAIAITGDWFDEYAYSKETALALTEKITGLAPVYYVTGNHELATPKNKQTLEAMRRMGVAVLDDERVTVTLGSSRISVVGVNDSLLKKRSGYYADLERLAAETGGDYSVLLAHRPEYAEKYWSLGFDLTLSGHTHGGQVRLPFIGAVAAPNQRPLPVHSYGLYGKGNYLVVSAGLGVDRAFPYRVYTPPEVVVVTLKRAQSDR